MIYQDRVFGEIRIEELVISELVNSKPLQRLKDIDQMGYALIYHNPRNLSVLQVKHTRFEHSLGVYWLLKRFGAPLQEQVAGLIHDVSHTAFSHCIDYALAGGSEKEHSYQDNTFKGFVEKSEIPAILKKYDFETDYITNEHNFPLLEKPLPDLCADRLDYSFRASIAFQEITRQESDYFLANLLAEDNRWFFRDFETAQKYAELFLKINNLYFAGIHSAVMFRTVGDVLKYALEKKYILKDDLYATDKEVLDKIKRNLNDEKLKLLFDRMNDKVKFELNPQNYDAHVFCKSRIVDPLFRDNGQLKRISEVSEKWKEIVQREMQPKEYFIKFKR